MRINPPRTPINLSQQQADELILTIKANDLFSQSDQKLLCQIILMFLWLQHSLRETRISLSKIKKLVFGQKSEKSKQGRTNNTDDPEHDDTLSENKPDLKPNDSTMNNNPSSEPCEPESSSQLSSGDTDKKDMVA